jgi:hypothetical protein
MANTKPKNKGGRPRKYSKQEILQTKIDEYFKMCDEKEKPYTITGLCLYLDIDRSTLLRYEEKEEYCNTIKRAKNKIENYVEENSLKGLLNPTVSIFNLKNNFGWKDKQEIETNQNIKVDNPYKELSVEELKKLAGD